MVAAATPLAPTARLVAVVLHGEAFDMNAAV
jgi:hypothetical protein